MVQEEHDVLANRGEARAAAPPSSRSSACPESGKTCGDGTQHHTIYM